MNSKNCKHFDCFIGQCTNENNKFRSCADKNCPKNREFVRARAFENHYAEAIIDDIKHIEVASQIITKPGKIAIYAKKKDIPKKKKDELIKHFSRLCDSGFINFDEFHKIHKNIKYPEHKGCVIGTVEIAYVRKNISQLQFYGSVGMHLAPDEYYKEGHTHFWVLKNPVRFDKPIPIKWNSGGPWGKIEKDKLYSNAISL